MIIELFVDGASVPSQSANCTTVLDIYRWILSKEVEYKNTPGAVLSFHPQQIRLEAEYVSASIGGLSDAVSHIG